jgi:stage II sporulation protein AA (anti-sigma F factor antagonist)
VTVGSAGGGEQSSHALLLYRHELHRQTRVVSWVRQGLTRGEKILYSTVPGDTLVPALRTGGREAALALRQGQLSFVPALDFFPGARQAELVHQALDEGYPAVRLSARADAALSHESLDEYQAIDHLMDELCLSLPVTALCQLDAGGASPETLMSLIGSHSGVVEDAQMRLRRRAGQVVISGEVDFSSAAVLTEALRSVCRMEDPSRMVVDLSELTFIDVSACRGLEVGTEEFRRAGGRVTFSGAGGHLRKVMHLLGMHRMAGIEVL